MFLKKKDTFFICPGMYVGDLKVSMRQSQMVALKKGNPSKYI